MLWYEYKLAATTSGLIPEDLCKTQKIAVEKVLILMRMKNLVE